MQILGIGGHAKVVIETVKLAGFEISGIYDDDINLLGKLYQGSKVLGTINNSITGEAIISIGNNSVRHKIHTLLSSCIWKTIIHPKAIVSEDVEIGEGSIIMAGAIIQAGVKIGKHTIINTGSCIDHDCEIGDFVHIAPSCGLAGGVKVGDGSFIGIGTSIIPNCIIGDWVIVGAGSTVINNLSERQTFVGVPAKKK
jgi:sugar O-acyltransferase (sialic acid O-acetyltransferase NeuD family)